MDYSIRYEEISLQIVYNQLIFIFGFHERKKRSELRAMKKEKRIVLVESESEKLMEIFSYIFTGTYRKENKQQREKQRKCSVDSQVRGGRLSAIDDCEMKLYFYMCLNFLIRVCRVCMLLTFSDYFEWKTRKLDIALLACGRHLKVSNFPLSQKLMGA